MTLKDCFFQIYRNCEVVMIHEPTFPSDSEARSIIASCAKDVMKSQVGFPLYPGMGEPMNNAYFTNQISFFDTFIENIIKNDFRARFKDETNLIQDVLSNVLFFPFILRQERGLLTKDDILLDDDLLDDFARVMRVNPEMFNAFQFDLVLKYTLTYDEENSFHHIRALILLLIFENFFDSENFKTDLHGLILHILDLPAAANRMFFYHLGLLPKTFCNILSMIQTNLTLFIIINKKLKFSDDQFFEIAQFLTCLRRCSSFPILPQLFVNEEYSKKVKINELFEDRGLFLYDHPAILSLDLKLELFAIASNVRQIDAAGPILAPRIVGENADFEIGQRFLDSDEEHEIRFNLDVRRTHLLSDTISIFKDLKDVPIFKKLYVTFIGEEGIDQGGVSREYLHLITSMFFNPDYGMFDLVQCNTYWFNKASSHPTNHYRILGTIVGLAIYNGVILPIRFPRLMYKKLLRKKITNSDYKEIDPEVFNSFQNMLEMKKNGDDVSNLCMYFSASCGTGKEVPLIKGGENKEVTNENVEQFVEKYIKWQTTFSIKKKFNAFKNGFMIFFKKKYFHILEEDELDIMVSGEEIFDWDDLKKGIYYSDGYNPDSRAVKWFWEVFDEFSYIMKLKFLMFTTGSCRAPVGGLGKIGITIQMASDKSKLPVSHTCTMVFCLPNYDSKEDLRHKITMALQLTEGFSLI